MLDLLGLPNLLLTQHYIYFLNIKPQLGELEIEDMLVLRQINKSFFGAGLAVMTVMLVTTCLTSLVIVVCWHKPPIIALCFLLFFFF